MKYCRLFELAKWIIDLMWKQKKFRSNDFASPNGKFCLHRFSVLVCRHFINLFRLSYFTRTLSSSVLYYFFYFLSIFSFIRDCWALHFNSANSVTALKVGSILAIVCFVCTTNVRTLNPKIANSTQPSNDMCIILRKRMFELPKYDLDKLKILQSTIPTIKLFVCLQS